MLQHAAQVTAIKAEFLAQLNGSNIRAMRQLIQHAYFGQRKVAMQQVFLQDSNLPGVKAIESADSMDGIVLAWDTTGWAHMSAVYQIVD